MLSAAAGRLAACAGRLAGALAAGAAAGVVRAGQAGAGAPAGSARARSRDVADRDSAHLRQQGAAVRRVRRPCRAAGRARRADHHRRGRPGRQRAAGYVPTYRPNHAGQAGPPFAKPRLDEDAVTDM